MAAEPLLDPALLARLGVRPLVVRGLHEVRGRAVELTGDAVVEGQLDQIFHPGNMLVFFHDCI